MAHRILIVEATEAASALVLEALPAPAFETRVARSLSQAQDALAETSFDVVFAGMRGTGDFALDLLRSTQECPLVVLAGQGEENFAVSCIKAGASDYLVATPEVLRELPRTVERVRREWERHLEHLRVQAALHRSEERLRLAMEATSDGIWDWDLAEDRIYWSPRAYAMLGYHPGEFTLNVEVWQALMHPEEVESTVKSLWSQVEKGASFALECQMRTRSSEWRWVQTRGKVVASDPNGRPLRMAGTHTDIHERLQSEHLLREQKQRLERLFEQANDAIFVVDSRDGRFISVNGKAEKMVGWSREQLVGMHHTQLHPPENKTKVEELLQAIASGHSSNFSITELLHRDGHLVRVEQSSGIIEFVDGRRVVQGIFRDVTERLQLEEQLRHAQKMEAIGQLAGGVAHDFNNVLAAIMLQMSMLQADKGLPPATYATLSLLESSARRASDLTRQLLLFGRRQPAKMQVQDADLLVANLLKMLRRLIGETISLEFVPRPGLHWILADTGMIEQVIMNLVVNARDAMPQGGRIDLRIERNPEPQGAPPEEAKSAVPFAFIEVKDTGHGIPPEILGRIFDPFFTTKQQGKGTGLGLATAYSIVKQHGGCLSVESEEGRGSVFQIHLPLSAPPQASAKVPLRKAETSRGRGRVMLVEDDHIVRTFTSLALRSSGYQVTEARDGREALSLFEANPAAVDFLLTDMVMPNGVSGWELTQQLRVLRDTLPVVIMSGYPEQLPRESLLPANRVGFLQKPYDTAKMNQALRHAAKIALNPSAEPMTPTE